MSKMKRSYYENNFDSLSKVRILQKNLIYVVGLSSQISDKKVKKINLSFYFSSYWNQIAYFHNTAK